MNKNFLLNFFCLLFLSCNSFAVTATINPSSSPTINKNLPKINLNQADSKSLANSISGIGPKRADAIVKYREEKKGFKSLDELAQVPGLGEKFFNKHKEEIASLFSLNTN